MEHRNEKNNTKGLVPYQKGQSGNLNGRPRKLITQLTAIGYKPNEVNDTLMNLLALKRDELKRVFDNPDSTVLEASIAGAVLSSISKKSLNIIETVLSRAIGRPRETQEIKAEVNLEAFKVRVVTCDIPFASCEADIDTEKNTIL